MFCFRNHSCLGTLFLCTLSISVLFALFFSPKFHDPPQKGLFSDKKEISFCSSSKQITSTHGSTPTSPLLQIRRGRSLSPGGSPLLRNNCTPSPAPHQSRQIISPVFSASYARSCALLFKRQYLHKSFIL